MSGKVREHPYASRVFGLQKTHLIEHAAATSEDHLDFHLWALSFFVGTRPRSELGPSPVLSGEHGRIRAMQRQRGELVPIGEVVADLDRPVQAIRKTSC